MMQKNVCRRAGDADLAAFLEILFYTRLVFTAVVALRKFFLVKPDFFREGYNLGQRKAFTIRLRSLIDRIGVFPERVVSSQFMSALRSFGLFLRAGIVKGQGKVTIHPIDFVLISLHDFLRCQVKAFAKGA